MKITIKYSNQSKESFAKMLRNGFKEHWKYIFDYAYGLTYRKQGSYAREERIKPPTEEQEHWMRSNYERIAALIVKDAQHNDLKIDKFTFSDRDFSFQVAYINDSIIFKFDGPKDKWPHFIFKDVGTYDLKISVLNPDKGSEALKVDFEALELRGYKTQKVIMDEIEQSPKPEQEPPECPSCKGKGSFIDPLSQNLESCGMCNGSGYYHPIDPDPAKLEHDLYEKGDDDIPSSILDENGDVMYAMCRRCKQAESELGEYCPF